MEAVEEPIAVMFRLWKSTRVFNRREGRPDHWMDLVAVFPELTDSLYGETMTAYMYHGGHGECAWPIVVGRTIACHDQHIYQPMIEHLLAHYEYTRFRVVKRVSRKMDQERRASAAKTREWLAKCQGGLREE